MLIHAGGINRADAPVALYHVDEGSGSIFIGDKKARIMLTPEEIRDLRKILEPFAQTKEG